MRERHFRPCWLVLGLLLTALPSAGWALSLSEKAGLQAAMQRHVDRQTVDGVYLHLNRKTGAVEPLHAVTAHPMILTMGPHFVLCFEFRNDAGKNVNVDFYVAKKDTSYVVFHTAFDDRDVLKGLMASGKVKRAE